MKTPQNILLTGASRGIGRELAKEIAKNGHNLYLIARDKIKLKSLKNELIKYEGKIHFIECDVSDYNQCKATFDIVKGEFGSIDIAIMNAAVGGNADISSAHLSDFRHTIDVNLFGVVNFAENLFPYFIKRGKGKFVSVSSLADVRGFEGSGVYCASKSALTKYMEAARSELYRHGVDVVTIKPGFIETDMTAENEFKMPFLMSPQKAGKLIYKAIERDEIFYYFPWQTKLLSYLIKILPDNIYNIVSKWRKI